MKTCERCGETKPLIEFPISNTTTTKIYRKRLCNICSRKNYNETYKVRKFAPPQSLTCDLCGKECKTVMDHDHKTLTFRGWLCNNCNSGLGQFKDDTKLLQEAINYIKRWSVNSNEV